MCVCRLFGLRYCQWIKKIFVWWNNMICKVGGFLFFFLSFFFSSFFFPSIIHIESTVSVLGFLILVHTSKLEAFEFAGKLVCVHVWIVNDITKKKNIKKTFCCKWFLCFSKWSFFTESEWNLRGEELSICCLKIIPFDRVQCLHPPTPTSTPPPPPPAQLCSHQIVLCCEKPAHFPFHPFQHFN